jgi:hypothetical protein
MLRTGMVTAANFAVSRQETGNKKEGQRFPVAATAVFGEL